ncbi:MAG: phosphatidate cytidylyltransferase [Firmicutes bacterium]|nr:phosphatidate cytidylyltransferase [Bacillota bacterium]
MKTRLISVAVMLPLIIFLILGKQPMLIAGLVISCGALYEFYKGFENLEIRSSLPVGIALTLAYYLIMFAAFFVVKDKSFYESLLPFWFSMALFASVLLIISDQNHNILGPTYTFFGLIYIVFLFSTVILIERTQHAWVFLPFVIAYMSDTGGYLGGRYFGKTKLAPVLSPNKTREGSIGGIIFGVAGALIFALIAARSHIIGCLVLGLTGSVIAELGDLAASAFKRKMGIKDYSNLIPGHGGIIDRIDSVLFTAPLVYTAILVFIKL